VGAALLITVTVHVVAAGTFYLYDLFPWLFKRDMPFAEIDKSDETPVQVTPVLDLDSPLLKLGGKKPKLPDMWAAPPKPTPAVAKPEAFASTKAGEKVEDIPPEDKDMADAGTEPPPEDAAVSEELADAAAEETTDANPIEVSDLPPGVTEEGDPGGVKGGTETDPAKVNAAKMYHARVTSFLNRFMSGQCAGAEGVGTGATISLSGLTVTAVSVAPSGNAEFDSRVPGALAGAVGQSIPPPPENFPEFLKPSFSVGVRCPK
jgi:hypothetical protein